MRRLVSLGPNMNHGGGFVHSVENAILSDANLPGWIKMFPRWNEAAQQLAISGLHVWLMEELTFDGFDDLPAKESRQRRDFNGGVLGDINLKNGHRFIESGVGATCRC